MKENYENITCEIVMFDTPDVITSSAGSGVVGGHGDEAGVSGTSY